MSTTGGFLGGAGVGIVLVAAAVVLMGTPTKSATQALDCDDDSKPGTCMIKVDVVSCGFLNLRHCVSVADDPVVIHNKKKIDAYWILVNNKYKFANNGIVIRNADNDFGDCKSKDDLTFVCTNKHSKSGNYKYTVNVQGLNPYDPWVIND